MILFVTSKISGSANILLSLCSERRLSAFRFNTDMFDQYRFAWSNDEFEIADPTGRICKSNDITQIVFYKGALSSVFPLPNGEKFDPEQRYVISWINKLYNCIVCYGMVKGVNRLWSPYELAYAKTLQMKLAKKYFEVPDFVLHWGTTLSSRQVIAKTLTQMPMSNGEMSYARVVDRADLHPDWPWFTQEIADGNRDATVVYINGKVHCFQFAAERGDLTDWRVTQGTDANQWIPWDAGAEFEEKIRLYMKDLGLKFGRLDFIIGGKEPQFLEVNPCGQFGWLDDEETLTLHNEVLDAILDPSTVVKL